MRRVLTGLLVGALVAFQFGGGVDYCDVSAGGGGADTCCAHPSQAGETSGAPCSAPHAKACCQIQAAIAPEVVWTPPAAPRVAATPAAAPAVAAEVPSGLFRPPIA